MTLKTTHYKDLLHRFDTHIISTKSIKSGNHYTAQIKSFLIHLESKHILSLNQVDQSTMTTYLHHLSNRPKQRGTGTLSVRTINDHLSTLRLFSIRMISEQLMTKGLPIPNRIKNLDHSNDLVREILTTTEIKTLFDACIDNRERALIALAYGCGLRRSTLENLKDTQINFLTGHVTALRAKNNKTRQVPISDFFIPHLKAYSYDRLKILANVNKRRDAFFINSRGNPLTGRKLNQLLQTMIKRTQNHEIIDKNITLHCLRHSIATHLMDAGQSFEYIQTFLGHSYADTTLIYAKRRNIKNQYMI